MFTQIVLGGLCCGAVAQDIATGKIRNFYNVSSALVAFVCVLAAGEPGIGDSLLGLAFSILLGMLLWRMGAIRAGDAKFMWTIGILKGWKGFGVSMLYAILAGGVIALGILLVKKDFRRRLLRIWLYLKNSILLQRMERYEAESRDVFPFSIPLAVGCVLETVLGGILI